MTGFCGGIYSGSRFSRRLWMNSLGELVILFPRFIERLALPLRVHDVEKDISGNVQGLQRSFDKCTPSLRVSMRTIAGKWGGLEKYLRYCEQFEELLFCSGSWIAEMFNVVIKFLSIMYNYVQLFLQSLHSNSLFFSWNSFIACKALDTLKFNERAGTLISIDPSFNSNVNYVKSTYSASSKVYYASQSFIRTIVDTRFALINRGYANHECN